MMMRRTHFLRRWWSGELTMLTPGSPPYTCPGFAGREQANALSKKGRRGQGRAPQKRSQTCSPNPAQLSEFHSIPPRRQ